MLIRHSSDGRPGWLRNRGIILDHQDMIVGVERAAPHWPLGLGRFARFERSRLFGCGVGDIGEPQSRAIVRRRFGHLDGLLIADFKLACFYAAGRVPVVC